MKTVLVLGLCLFAGGVRFSEQGFDPSEWRLAGGPLADSHLHSCDATALFPSLPQRRCRAPTRCIPLRSQRQLGNRVPLAGTQHPQHEPRRLRRPSIQCGPNLRFKKFTTR